MNVTDLSFVELFQLYYTPLLVYFGIIGNSLSVYVFFDQKLRKLTSSYYLRALALSDSGFLICLFLVWLSMVDVDLFNRPGVCQIIVYQTSVCSFLSAWFVVSFTVERFVAVNYPLLRTSLCTVKRAKTILLYLLLFALGLFSPLLFFAGDRQDDLKYVCSIDPGWGNVAGVFNIVDTVVTFVVPVLLVLVLNVSIAATIRKMNRVGGTLSRRDVQIECKTNRNVTKMLLCVSTIFLCLNLPSYVMRLLTYLIESRQLVGIDLQLFMTVQHCCLQIFNTNFGINFVLYCTSGSNFRRAVVRRLKCLVKI